MVPAKLKAFLSGGFRFCPARFGGERDFPFRGGAHGAAHTDKFAHRRRCRGNDDIFQLMFEPLDFCLQRNDALELGGGQMQKFFNSHRDYILKNRFLKESAIFLQFLGPR